MGSRRPKELPNTPAGQSTHSPEVEKRPGGHRAGREVTDPGAQSYPASQGPTHCGEEAPGVLPNRPALQGPAQSAADVPSTPVYLPGGHSSQTAARVLFDECPTGHGIGAWVPSGQKNPCWHSPLQVGLVMFVACPKYPARHGLHNDDPSRLYRPAGHLYASPGLGVVNPGGQA